jgi:hypothetical protein
MAPLYFAPAPPNTLVSVGGFTCVKPKDWQEYLDRLVKDRYPDFFADERQSRNAARRAPENECILESLEKYLFNQFGTAIPQENLFKYYNQDGEGILPEFMLEAIAAVIEPLGYEIDSILAPDEELRRGLGWPDKVFGIEKASEFHNKAGICMINIQDGYSHAFYWEKMDQAKFTRDQFRIAVLVKRCGDHPASDLSAVQGLEAYSQMLRGYTKTLNESGSSKRLISIEAAAYNRCIESQRVHPQVSFRETLQEHLSKILDLFETVRDEKATAAYREEEEMLIEVGRLLRRILFEKKEILLLPS